MITDDKLIDEARDIYSCDDIQVDDDAQVIATAEGHWVQAWVFIATDE